MDQDKFGKLIRKIRKDNNLTQKDLADRYNVTYQAVSKWENGINMPDTMLIRKIAKDFSISIDDMLDGNYSKNNKKSNNKLFILLIVLLVIIITILIFIHIKSDNNFKFKRLKSNCDEFNITGIVSYNKSKTAIYISNIDYCGIKDTTKYKKIECTLYEQNNDIIKKIDSYNYKGEKLITLDNFFKNTVIIKDEYSRTCREYKKNSLYLEINAVLEDDNIITHKIPLILDDNCIK